MYYIYIIKNKINDKVYIGQTKNINNRWSQHKSNAKRRPKNYHLYNAMIQYGIENFYIKQIDSSNSIEENNLLEAKYILEYKSSDREFGYNIKDGGHNRPLTQETKDRISASKIGRYRGIDSPNYGKSRPKEVIDKILKTKQDNPIVVSKETRELMSNNNRGINNAKAVLTEQDVINIKQLIIEGKSNEEISNLFPVNKGAISKIRSGRTWKHIVP